ncbi:MAG: hypothetical protein HY694_01225 [Deltaproteobacteria bacterium]|nr:hypothetical protein [Deltaproteobacteria bacterium]
MKGWPVMTLLRGEVIIERGTFVSSTGKGQCCLRKIDPAILEGPAA